MTFCTEIWKYWHTYALYLNKFQLFKDYTCDLRNKYDSSSNFALCPGPLIMGNVNVTYYYHFMDLFSSLFTFSVPLKLLIWQFNLLSGHFYSFILFFIPFIHILTKTTVVYIHFKALILRLKCTKRNIIEFGCSSGINAQIFPL